MGFITNERIDSLLKRGEVDEALRQPVKSPDAQRAGVADFVASRVAVKRGAEDAAYAGLTLGDFLYDYIRIDPEVVRGVEFARAADVDGILSFARFADSKAALSGASLEGFNSSLHGYVAEQVVAHHLIAQGHDVVFPETPNNPGWDLNVDGHPFQVKCLENSGGVYEHIRHFPQIPVIVNAELAESVGDHDGVYVDLELHHDAIRQATEDALNRGRDLAAFEIPWISIGVSGASNFYYMLKNDTTWTAMFTCAATDAAGRTVGGVAGKIAGATAGSVLFGPAGVIVVGLAGTIAGAMAGRRLAAGGRTVLVGETEESVRRAVRRAAEAALSGFPEKLVAWKRKTQQVSECLDGRTANQKTVRQSIERRLNEHLTYWEGKEGELRHFALGFDDAAQSLVFRLLTAIRRASIHAHHVQGALKELADRLREYQEGCRAFRTADWH